MLALLLLVAAAWVAFSYFQPFAGSGGAPVRVVIPSGASVADIGSQLEDRGVISSAFFFQARARVDGAATNLKPGAYTLRYGASNAAILAALTTGVPPDTVSVTVPEGSSRREIAPTVGKAGLGRGYVKATESSPTLDPSRYGAPKDASLEGFLYPSTYELKKGASPKALVTRQLQAFKQEIGRVDLRAARKRNLTPFDVLTVASMIEREAQVDPERKVIASVIYNRLRSGEPLAIDATIRYATHNWSRPLLQSQLLVNSPYNTRTNAGLPPGPIGNPGRKSIEAAANPANTAFRYYVVKPGTCGEHAFSKTGAQFERDRANYETERARRGGKSPTTC